MLPPAIPLYGKHYILNLPRITAYEVNSHALPTVPVYKENRIVSLLCTFKLLFHRLAISAKRVNLFKYCIK